MTKSIYDRRTRKQARVLLSFALAGLLLDAGAPSADAHQPVVVGDRSHVTVTDPETSRAFYGRLSGEPARYVVVSRTPFTLYAQMTVPDVRGAHRDFRMRITGPRGRLADITTPAARWRKFYEPFGGDHYLTGREFRRRVPGGRYTIDVSSPSNSGLYVLAIGEAERWGPVAAVRAVALLPEIKREWFGESLGRAWLSRTVPIALIAIAAVAALVLALRGALRGRRSQPGQAQP